MSSLRILSLHAWPIRRKMLPTISQGIDPCFSRSKLSKAFFKTETFEITWNSNQIILNFIDSLASCSLVNSSAWTRNNSAVKESVKCFNEIEFTISTLDRLGESLISGRTRWNWADSRSVETFERLQFALISRSPQVISNHWSVSRHKSCLCLN